MERLIGSTPLPRYPTPALPENDDEDMLVAEPPLVPDSASYVVPVTTEYVPDQ